MPRYLLPSKKSAYNFLPLHTLHTDRAREFGTAQMRTWLAQHQISRTTTSGAEPAGNATAEHGVQCQGQIKGASEAIASPCDWPMAAAHASADLWKKAFPASPIFKGKMAASGQQVWYKAKAYTAVREKEMDEVVNKDLPVRWRQASYRGPSMYVTEGHLLPREDGGLTIAKALRSGVVEPHREEPPLLRPLTAETEEDEPATPRRRTRKKASLNMLTVGEGPGDEWDFLQELSEEATARAYMLTRGGDEAWGASASQSSINCVHETAEARQTWKRS